MSMDSLGKNTGGGQPFPSPGNLPNPGIEPGSPSLQEDPLLSEPLFSLLLPLIDSLEQNN